MPKKEEIVETPPEPKPEPKPESKPEPKVEAKPISIMGDPKPEPLPRAENDVILKSFKELADHVAKIGEKVDKLVPTPLSAEPPKKEEPKPYKLFEEFWP